MKIDEKELFKFYDTFKNEIFTDIDFGNYYIKSVILDGVVDGIIESVINIHSHEPDIMTDFKINGMPVSMNYHIVRTEKISVKEYKTLLRKRKINSIIASSQTSF